MSSVLNPGCLMIMKDGIYKYTEMLKHEIVVLHSPLR